MVGGQAVCDVLKGLRPEGQPPTSEWACQREALQALSALAGSLELVVTEGVAEHFKQAARKDAVTALRQFATVLLQWLDLRGSSEVSMVPLIRAWTPQIGPPFAAMRREGVRFAHVSNQASLLIMKALPEASLVTDSFEQVAAQLLVFVVLWLLEL